MSNEGASRDPARRDPVSLDRVQRDGAQPGRVRNDGARPDRTDPVAGVLPGAQTGAGVQSVDRAISALEVLARNGSATVSEVAAAVGVHKSTASRLLGALSARGMVEQDGERGRYRLGFGIMRLAGSMPAQLDVIAAGRQFCDELCEQTGETVNIAVVRDGCAVNVHQVSGSSAITVNSWVGRPTPLHATSSGKVLLAYLPEPELTAVLADGLERFTDRTITDGGALRMELDRVRRNGFASTLAEYEDDLNAVAAAVYGADEQVVAAVSVSGPAYRMPAAVLAEIAAAVRDAAAEISARMGHLG